MKSTVATLASTLPGHLPQTHASVVPLAGLATDGAPLVRVAAADTPVPARLATHVAREWLTAAVAQGQHAVVVFEGADTMKPIIIGLLERSGVDAGLRPGVATAPQHDATSADAASQRIPCVEADVDGRRVRVSAQDEIVLQCGSASITLRRNGRVIVRGTYVETYSEGTNRIKGGQVQIN